MRHMAEFIPRQAKRDKLYDSRPGEQAPKGMTSFMAYYTGSHEINIGTSKTAISIASKPLACKPQHRRQREHPAEQNDDLEHRPLYC